MLSFPSFFFTAASLGATIIAKSAAVKQCGAQIQDPVWLGPPGCPVGMIWLAGKHPLFIDFDDFPKPSYVNTSVIAMMTKAQVADWGEHPDDVEYMRQLKALPKKVLKRRRGQRPAIRLIVWSNWIVLGRKPT